MESNLSAKELSIVDLWLTATEGIKEIGNIYYKDQDSMQSFLCGMQAVVDVLVKLGFTNAEERLSTKIGEEALKKEVNELFGDTESTVAEVNKFVSSNKLTEVKGSLGSVLGVDAKDITAKDLENLKSLPTAKSIKKNRAKGDVNKILVLSDLHIPYHDINAINYALDKEKDAGVLVLLGDLFDESQHSKFPHDGSVNTRSCVEDAKNILDVLSPMFHEIYLVEGNHDARSIHKAQTFVPGVEVLSPFVQVLFDRDPDSYLKPRYPNVKMVSNTPCPKDTPLVENPVLDVDVFTKKLPIQRCGRFLVIGDAVFMHTDKSSKNPGATTNLIIKDQIANIQREYGYSGLKCIIQAHTHKISKISVNDTLGIECGCLVQHQAYQEKTHIYGVLGYAVVHQNDGVTDWNKSNPYFIGRG